MNSSQPSPEFDSKPNTTHEPERLQLRAIQYLMETNGALDVYGKVFINPDADEVYTGPVGEGDLLVNGLSVLAMKLQRLIMRESRLTSFVFPVLSKLHVLCLTNHESLIHLGPGSLNDSLPSLKSLRIEQTGLRFLPSLQGMSHLHDITVANCPVEVLPFGLASLISLRTISFVNTSLRCLDEALSALCNLKSLDVSGNLLTDISRESVEGLTKLDRLCANDNQLWEVPYIASKNLSVLELRNNRLHSISPTLADLVHLTHLHLEGNQLKTLPLKALASIPSLQTLHISNNPLEDRCFGPNSSTATEGLRSAHDHRNPKSTDLLKLIAKEYCGFDLVGGGGEGIEVVVRREEEKKM